VAVELLVAARAEIHDAAGWYEERRRGFGRKLTRAVREALAGIKRFPRSGSPWLSGKTIEPVRRVPVKGFPYVLVYVTSPRVVVIAFAHASRRPRYWLERLRDV
jgi:plasmid stabilization system protein ParE